MKIAEHGPNLASLQELVDSVPALIHTAHPDGSVDFFNQRWLEFVGLRLEDLEGWKWTAAVHPDDVTALVARWRACLVSGEPFEFESRVRRADGAYRWMLHQKLPLRSSSGEIVKWYGSSVDIDDRKRADEERTEAEFYLAEGQRLGHTGSWAFNVAGFDYWSPELLDAIVVQFLAHESLDEPDIYAAAGIPRPPDALPLAPVRAQPLVEAAQRAG